jgi:hypothetical protein
MAEKRGQTEQLKYDFNTARASYIRMKAMGKWSRVSCRDFRSYCGERSLYLKDEETGEYDYVPYEGPIYYWNSNKICKEPIEEQIQYLHDSPRKVFARPHEKYLLNT